jgi:hypothetical protein
MVQLSPELAAAFAHVALGHVTREYPHKMDHVLDGPGHALEPHVLHPIFYGSYDWHSCVHGYWTLATILRRHPDIHQAKAIRALFDQALTREAVEGECAYLRRPSERGFERPYGWAWLLKLQAELLAHDEPWAGTMRPLAELIVQRFHEYLPLAAYPVRAGAHANTAFALALGADYARTAADENLLALLEAKARAWYLDDAGAQAWEPSGDDFLSPTLIEAECLRRLIPGADFRAWLADFLPRAGQRQPASLFVPAIVSDRSDGKIVHLDGLNLSRAWCWRELATAFPADDPLAATAREAAERHLAVSLPHIEGDYVGEHWLATFAMLALTAGEA